jgi:hypothetical protein
LFTRLWWLAIAAPIYVLVAIEAAHRQRGLFVALITISALLFGAATGMQYEAHKRAQRDMAARVKQLEQLRQQARLIYAMTAEDDPPGAV